MIKHNLVIFSQNVRKNKILTDTILETQKNQTNIILIQEPPHFLIRHVPSNSSPNSDPLYGMASHPEWTLFIQNNLSQDNFPRCGGGRQKTLCVILTYVEITSSGVNYALKNLRGGKSRSGKVIKKGI